MQFFFLGVATLANYWIWRVFSLRPLLFLLLIVTTALLFFSTSVKKKWVYLLFAPLFVVMLFTQYKTTKLVDLTNFSNDEVRQKDMRLREYPPLNLPIAYWLEARPESTAFYRILKNFSEVVDPNLYFFANHPRGRVGFDEFEKFSFLTLPLFLYGSALLIEKRNNRLFLITFLISLICLSLWGSNNKLGPFILFPFITVLISLGFIGFYDGLKKKWAKK